MQTLTIVPEKNKLSCNEKLYILICFVIYFLWSCIFTSMDYGPDEYMRYDVPKFIFQNGSLPYGWEESIRNPIWGFSYGFNIKLLYLFSAFFMKIASAFSSSETVLLIAARFTSVIAGTITVYFSILIAKLFFHDQKIGYLFISLMSFTPQIIFVNSYVNLDGFTLMSSTIIIYAWILGLSTYWNRKSVLILGIGMGLCLGSYEFAYTFLVGSFFLYCISCIQQKKTLKSFVINGLAMLLIVFCISGWVLIRNYVLYDGDIFSLQNRIIYGELYAQDAFKPSLRITPKSLGVSIKGMLILYPWLINSFKSFFSVLGYMNILASNWVYYFYSVLLIIGVLGLFLKRKNTEKNCSHFLISIVSLLCVILTVSISVYYSWACDYQSQGRYLLSAAPVIFFVVSVGVEKLCLLISGKNKTILRNSIIYLLCTIIIATSLEAFIHVSNVFQIKFFTLH